MPDSNDIDLSHEIDLHFFSPKDIKYIYDEFISFNQKNNILQVKIIHGKGKSVLKHRILKLLESDSRIKSWASDGSNWGAMIIYLKEPDQVF